MIKIFCIPLLGLTIGLLASWIMIYLASRLNLTDVAIERSSHKGSIPKGAGMGIVITFCIAAMYLKISPFFWFPVLAISLISFLGGDKHCLSVPVRLTLQFGCCWCFLLCTQIPAQGYYTYLILFPLSVFIVGTANFYNFMDGIDGMAGITGIVAFILLLQIAASQPAYAVYGKLCQAMIGACTGFLCFNIPRARIFMGDVGSVTLGFVLSMLIVSMSESFLDFLVMTSFLMPFYMDEFFTIIVRLKNGTSLFTAHRKHIYQLLANEMDIKHWKISLSYGLTQAIIGEGAILISSFGTLSMLIMYYLLMTFLLLGFGMYIHQRAGRIK